MSRCPAARPPPPPLRRPPARGRPPTHHPPLSRPPPPAGSRQPGNHPGGTPSRPLFPGCPRTAPCPIPIPRADRTPVQRTGPPGRRRADGPLAAQQDLDVGCLVQLVQVDRQARVELLLPQLVGDGRPGFLVQRRDRKSTRLNSSH